MINKVGKLIKFGSLLYNMNVIKTSKSEERKNKALEYIQNLVDKEAGLFLKITQNFSTQANYNFTKQQIETSEIKNILLKELGTNYVRIMNLSESGVCASLSQVHFAQLPSTKSQIHSIVLKIKLPWIEKELEKQLSSLGLIPGIGPVKKWGIDLEGYKKSLNETISKELNYGLEVKNLLAVQEYKAELEKQNILVPIIFSELCTNNLIAMENLKGFSFEEVMSNWSEEDRQALGKLIATSFCFLVFKARIYQSDFNVGNFIYLKDNGQIKLGLIDFGSYRQIEKDQVDALINLIRNLSSLDEDQIITHLSIAGFDFEKLGFLKDEIKALCLSVFEPFITGRDFSFADFKMSENIESNLGEKKWWFRSAGTPEVFYLVRAYAGFLKMMSLLNIKLNMKNISDEVIGDQGIIPDQGAVQKPHQQTNKTDISINLQSKYLLITIFDKEKSQEILNSKFPIHVINDLGDIIDEKYLKILIQQGHNLSEIIAHFVSGGGHPGILITLEHENRTITISTK